MTLYDTVAEREYTLTDLYHDWELFRSEEPWNHAEDFMTELYEILMATVNGRNDCDVVGLTPAETCDYIISIRRALRRRA